MEWLDKAAIDGEAAAIRCESKGFLFYCVKNTQREKEAASSETSIGLTGHFRQVDGVAWGGLMGRKGTTDDDGTASGWLEEGFLGVGKLSGVFAYFFVPDNFYAVNQFQKC